MLAKTQSKQLDPKSSTCVSPLTLLHVLIIDGSSHQSLDVEHSVLRVQRSLILGRISDQSLSISEGNIRRGDAVSSDKAAPHRKAEMSATVHQKDCCRPANTNALGESSRLGAEDG